MANKPLTQRELKREKERVDVSKFVNVLNKSKQGITVQLRAPSGVDFFVGEQTINIFPGKTVKLPEHRVYMHQLVNHQKAGRLKILAIS